MRNFEKDFNTLWNEYVSSIEKDNTDLVERLNTLLDAADKFIIKYVNRNEEPEKMIPQMKNVVNDRYKMTYSDGLKDDNWDDISKRAARSLTSTTILYFTENNIDLMRRFENTLYNLLKYRIFIFNSPALFSAGAGNPKSIFIEDELSYKDYEHIYNSIDRDNFTSSACFILDIEDSIKGIFKTMSDAGIISKAGGGIGFNIGKLRPRYAHIKTSNSDSSGSIEFLRMYDSMGQVIKQGSKRRFAGMSVLLDAQDEFWNKEASLHADVEEFIKAKEKNTGESVLSNFNLSVGINNSKDLYSKYMNDGEIPLTFKGKTFDKVAAPNVDKDKYKSSVKARDFIDLVANNVWKSGDPGFLLFDKINKYNPFRKDIPMVSTNPCFGYDEKLLTDKGEISIGELDGQTVNVWSPFDNEYVQADVFKTGDKKTITLVTDSLGSLTVTPEHKVFDHETQDWMEAKDMLNRKITVFGYIDSKFSEEKDPLIIPYGYVTEIIENDVEPVYDFSMDKTHAGVVNGFVCHNCGERPGVSSSEYGIYDTCDLGHLDVFKFIDENNNFELEDFIFLARLSYYFLDFLHDMMMYPIDEVKKGVVGFRSVGLGFYGLAGALLKQNIKYDSTEGRAFGYLVMKSLEVASLYESFLSGYQISPMMFGVEGDPSIFPSKIWNDLNNEYEQKINGNYDTSLLDLLYNETLVFLKNDIKKGVITRRNINTTTVAPTGTTGNLGQTPEWGDVGSGLEPLFSFNYSRMIVSKDKNNSYEYFVSELLKKLAPQEVVDYVLENNGSLKGIDDEYKEYEDLFKTANDIYYLDHLKMQEAVQWACSSSISKTINMAKESTVDDVKDAYLFALKSPAIKGITIYRDGSLETQILSSSKPDNGKDKLIKIKITDGLEFNLDHKGKIHPMEREEVYEAETSKFKTDKGNNYLSISFNKKNDPVEIFLINGSEKAEIIGRLSTLSLRNGGSIDEVVEQLEKINHHTYSDSVAKNIKKIIEVHENRLNKKESENKLLKHNIKKYDVNDLKTLEKQGVLEYNSKGFYIEKETGKTVCKDCGSVDSIAMQEGCMQCTVCSVSKCS